MKTIFAQLDLKPWDALIADAEERSDSQIVLAVIKRSDGYAELPWKAFALGAALAGLSAALLNRLLFDWVSPITGHIAVLVTLGGGALCALLSILMPAFARCFLSKHRARVEVRQYAEGLFLHRALYDTPTRNGVLLLVSLFERRVTIIPDKGLQNRLNRKVILTIIAAMTSALKHHDLNGALETGLKSLADALSTTRRESPTPSGQPGLANDLIVEKGL